MNIKLVWQTLYRNFSNCQSNCSDTQLFRTSQYLFSCVKKVFLSPLLAEHFWELSVHRLRRVDECLKVFLFCFFKSQTMFPQKIDICLNFVSKMNNFLPAVLKNIHLYHKIHLKHLKLLFHMCGNTKLHYDRKTSRTIVKFSKVSFFLLSQIWQFPWHNRIEEVNTHSKTAVSSLSRSGQ